MTRPPPPGRLPPPPPAYCGPPGRGPAFEQSGALASALVGLAVGLVVIQWSMVVATPSAVRTYQDAVASGTPAFEIITAYDLLRFLWPPCEIAAFVVTGIWLARARRNADRIAPDQQRRSSVWVWLGWIVPVVSLWFPKQVIDDVWRTTVRAAVPADRPSTGWWWGLWIAAQLLGNLAARAFGLTGEPHVGYLEHLFLIESLSALALTVAMTQWIRVVRTVGRAQDALAAAVPASPWRPWTGQYPGQG